MTKHLIFPLLLWITAAGAAADAASERPDRLLVGIKEAPPFVIRHEDGRWSGISIDLWRAVAKDLRVDYRFQAFELDSLLKAVKEGAVDVALAAR